MQSHIDDMCNRSMDAIMMSLFNSRERELEDWKSIFSRASDRFSVCSAERVKENTSTAIIVVEWS